MSQKLFSPSLKLRHEPPNSKGVIMHVGTGNCLVSFRGRAFTAKMLDSDLKVGDSVSFIEHPRGTYHVRRNGISWYANPLENWNKAGKKACVAIEYFLRKCKKWSPFITGSDGSLIEMPLEFPDKDFGSKSAFDAIDTNHDGKISLEEWLASGGSETTFMLLDKNGDGYLDYDEFMTGKAGMPGMMKGSGMGTSGGTTTEELPGDLGPVDVNSWWGYFEYTPGSRNPIIERISQIDNDGIKASKVYSSGYNPAIDVPTGNEYLIGLDRIYYTKFQTTTESGNVRIYLKGSPGTEDNKVYFNAMHCDTGWYFFTSISPVPDGEYTESVTAAVAEAEARAAAANTTNPFLVIVQGTSDPVTFDVTLAAEHKNLVRVDVTYDKIWCVGKAGI